MLSKNIKGFSLVELMLVVAIIGVLAGIVTVSLSGIRDKGKDSKILAELSGTIQPILMCKSDNGTINSPIGTLGSGNICNLSNYGFWPITTSNYIGSSPAGVDWYFYIVGSTGDLCCNKKSLKCDKVAAGTCTTAKQL